jgi:ParB family chromosome partitioning protein
MATLDLDRKKPLGRGLASLIPEAQGPEGSLPGAQFKKDFFYCDIEKIVPNTYQPRKIFQKEALDELVESVKVHGIIQPLVVRQKDGRYELIAGERRWRAAQRAGLKQVPVVVKEIDGDQTSLEMAIIENIQREDLNCIEEAIAYQQLMDEFQLSQEDIATRVGKNRATVANTLRLLKLPAVIREDITAGKITMGHARALLSLESSEDQIAVREMIVKKKLSVRETERKVNELLREKNKTDGVIPGADNIHLRALEDDLRRIYGTMVKIVGNDTKGLIQFTYTTREDLMRIADELKGENVSTTN